MVGSKYFLILSAVIYIARSQQATSVVGGSVLDVGAEEARRYEPWSEYDERSLDFTYHDHDQLTRFLRSTTARYPNLTALYSIGKSVQGL